MHVQPAFVVCSTRRVSANTTLLSTLDMLINSGTHCRQHHSKLSEALEHAGDISARFKCTTCAFACQRAQGARQPRTTSWTCGPVAAFDCARRSQRPDATLADGYQRQLARQLQHFTVAGHPQSTALSFNLEDSKLAVFDRHTCFSSSRPVGLGLLRDNDDSAANASLEHASSLRLGCAKLRSKRALCAGRSQRSRCGLLSTARRPFSSFMASCAVNAEQNVIMYALLA